MVKRIRRVLVANRGEIALRVMRACRDLGLESVAVYSDADRDSRHLRYATHAQYLGKSAATQSYLAIDRVLAAARESAADAIHPGYGFLAENPQLAAGCDSAGLIFIGPTAETLQLVGDKSAARRRAAAAGVPTVPGSPEPVADLEEAAGWATKLGYPVMLKATAGGGGRGMRRVDEHAQLAASLDAASREAVAAFGDGRIYVEKALLSPRHIEFQILADNHGTRIHLGERECTLQRRHQKVLEEGPSPALDSGLRAKMGEAALAVIEATGYTNAGTVEFLLDAQLDFYFIEVNGRLQVEHPVTEVLTGVDLVTSQIALAQGERLQLGQNAVTVQGHALECRIYAEDPALGFAPSPGTVTALRSPSGPGVRDDSCLFEGYEVPTHYDPLVSKLVTWGPDRDTAIRRMRRALGEYHISGIATTIPLFQRILSDTDFLAGRFDTGYLDRFLGRKTLGQASAADTTDEARDRIGENVEVARLAAALGLFLGAGAAARQPANKVASAWKTAGRRTELRGPLEAQRRTSRT